MSEESAKRFYLIRGGRSQWALEGRLEGNLGPPLCLEGIQDAQRLAQHLKHLPMEKIYCGPGEAEQETARLIARHFPSVKVKVIPELEEVNLGLWQGLLQQEVEVKHRKAYRRWKEDPTSIQPPRGEAVEEALQRALRAIRSTLRRVEGNVAFVLPPMLHALLQCELRGEPLSRMWQVLDRDRWIVEVHPQAVLSKP